MPLSPIILPSYYAVLTDLWFEVNDVTVNGKHYDKKILGIDIFYKTMTGKLKVDVIELLERSREEATKKGWIFDIKNVRLLMLENLVEAYFSYAYVNIEYSAIKYERIND